MFHYEQLCQRRRVQDGSPSSPGAGGAIPCGFNDLDLTEEEHSDRGGNKAWAAFLGSQRWAEGLADKIK